MPRHCRGCHPVSPAPLRPTDPMRCVATMHATGFGNASAARARHNGSGDEARGDCLADDTAGTVEQALELWRRLARRNVMIKVPATAAGVPAIEELTARGVNVNVTLLFSVARYEQVMDAYLSGLERRARMGGARSTGSPPWPRSSSPASTPGRTPCSRRDRRCAVRWRSSTPAWPFARYQARLAEPRWMALSALGARPQRPLWASTATKDAAYSDVLDVEGADRSGRRQHDAGGHPARLRRPRPRHADPRAPRVAWGRAAWCCGVGREVLPPAGW